MRSLADNLVVQFDLEGDLKLDTPTLVKRLKDPGYYEPEKRILLALALIERLRVALNAVQAAMRDPTAKEQRNG